MIRVGLGLGVAWLGGVNYARNLLTAMLSLPDRQIEPVLLVGDRVDRGILAGFPPVEVIRSRWLERSTPHWAVRKAWQQAFDSDPFLERVLRAHQIDVVSHSDFLGKRTSPPTISWIPDFQHRQLPQFFKTSHRWYRDRDFRLRCRHATRIILSSDDAQQALAAFEPSCVEKSRVLRFVAQPSVSEATELPTLRAKYGVAGQYFHCPNQFWAHKNHRLLIDALAILKSRGGPVLVISTGLMEDYRYPRFVDELMTHADVLGVLDCFRALGVVPYNDLVGLMVNSVALINPSRAEGWSTSVEEGKSLGMRIILSDIPVHREQAPPDGVYVDPDDAHSLADAMQLAWATHDPLAEQARSERARRELPGRVLEFAQTYQDIVLEIAAPR